MPRFSRHDKARNPLRNSSGSPPGISRSTSICVLSHTGKARASRLSPDAVSFKIRLRRSEGSLSILTSLRRSNGFNAAVSVVRSMASRAATGPTGGGSGRFSAISSENCPLVRPKGRSTSSNRRAKARAARCTWRQRQQSCTRSVVSYGSVFELDTVRLKLISTYSSTRFRKPLSILLNKPLSIFPANHFQFELA